MLLGGGFLALDVLDFFLPRFLVGGNVAEVGGDVEVGVGGGGRG